MRIGAFLLCLLIDAGWAANAEIDRCFDEICPDAACKTEFNADQSAEQPAFSIHGNQLVATHRLQNIIASTLHEDYALVNAELGRRKVSEYYACLGYINSGAILKTDNKGHFVYQIVEGVIDRENVLIEGDITPADKDYISKVMLSGQDKEVLNIHAMRNRLVRLKRIGLYHNIKAELSPKSLGKAALQVKLDRKPNDFSGQIYTDNSQSTFVGRERIGFDLTYHGFDDPTNALSASGSLSKGLKSANLAYRVVDYRGDSIEVALSHSESIIIQSPLDDLDIKNTSDKLSMTGYSGLWQSSKTGRYAAESSQNATLGAFLTAELLQSRNTLLGRGFSFSDTEEDGRSKLGSLRGQIDWVSKSRNSAYSISNHLEWGMDIAGSPHFSDYALLGGSAGYKGAIDNNTQFTLRSLYQWANGNLPSAKKIGLGGAINLRGIANNTLFTDSALYASAQVDRKVGAFSPWAASSVTDGQLYLSAFIDHGLGANRDEDNPSKRLTSAGLGMQWQLDKDWSISFSWGKKIAGNFAVRDDSLFYFNLMKRFGQ